MRWTDLVGGLVFCLALTGTARAAGPIIAVFELEDRGSGLTSQARTNLSDLLATELAAAGFQVVPRDQVRARLLQAKTATYKDCYDQSCQIELGRELAAEKVVSSRLLKLGEACQLTLELYDLKKSATELAATAEKPCHEQTLVVGVREAVQKLGAPLRSAEVGPTEFERFLMDARRAQDEQARAAQAWDMLQGYSSDAQQPLGKRVEAVRRYLKEFPQAAQAELARERLARLLTHMPGQVRMRASPATARLLLDGQAVGQGEVALGLMPGRYELRAELEEHRPASRSIEVRPEETLEVALALEPIPRGTLKLDSGQAGALVRVDGKELGSTPIQAELPPGEYRLELIQAGHHPVIRRLCIESGALTQAELTSSPLPPDHTAFGHAAFWPGLALLALGGTGAGLASSYAEDYATGDRGAADRSKTWEGVMWGGFAGGLVLVATGIVLWALSTDGHDPESGAGVRLGPAGLGGSF
jgi:hypothetical protein